MSRWRGRLTCAERSSAPVSAARVRVASRFSSSATTLRTTARAVSLRGLGHRPVEREQRADQVDVRLDGLQHLRLQQQRGEAQPLDRVALHDLDDGAGEVRPDVAEPAGHVRRGAAEPRAPRRSPPRRPPGPVPPAAVERVERASIAASVPAEGAAGAVRPSSAAEHQPPAPQPLVASAVAAPGPRSVLGVPAVR